MVREGFCALVMLGAGLVFGAPVVPGLGAEHPLDEKQVGKVLTEELGCAACHEGMGKEGVKSGPDLSEVGSRVSADYLKRYLAAPHKTHPGTTMPDVLGGLPEAEKQKVSESISHYLQSLKSTEEKAASVAGDAKRGRAIYHEVGCVACHSPRDSEGNEMSLDGVVSLAHVGSKYHGGELAKFLGDPLKVRPGGRMPDLGLTSSETTALEAYLGSAVRPADAHAPTEDEVKLGKVNFEKYNCVACHETGKSLPSQAGPKLSEMDLSQGCLTGDTVDYQLDAGQVKAIRASLEKPLVFSDADRVTMRLTKLNCISCHVRDDFGGIAEGLEAYFHTTEEGLGNEGRTPPPLTKIGGKLKPEWLSKVLYDGLTVRPYMLARMPQYGREALAELPELLAKVDELPEVELLAPGREDKPMINNGGHLLLGEKGLNCIACHNYNGKESQGMKGLDLITSYQRLQPGWFYEFMQNPGAHRPGIIMPSYWPDGQAVQTDILGGDTHEQLRALWFQFSLGRSARDPAGLRSMPNALEVTDRVRVYRGRSKIAGYRGIAVGYPGGMNYAFNAENGALTGIWKGEYVSANWRSQAAGDFSPAPKSTVVTLAQEVGFLQLADDGAEWPLVPVMTKEAPVNPDPLYPRNRGYAFQGYAFDEAGNPTLMYECGEIEIADRSVVDGEKGLKRTFELTSPKAGVVYFRALTGGVSEKSEGRYATSDLSVTFSGGGALLRSMGNGDGKELLIKIPVKAGKTTYTLNYELLR